MPSPYYPIKTERLLVRPFRQDDLEDLFAIQSREDVARYLYRNPLRTPTTRHKFRTLSGCQPPRHRQSEQPGRSRDSGSDGGR
jgi:RimJ/RimL family protein N-acetyltransferase